MSMRKLARRRKRRRSCYYCGKSLPKGPEAYAHLSCRLTAVRCSEAQGMGRGAKVDPWEMQRRLRVERYRAQVESKGTFAWLPSRGGE